MKTPNSRVMKRAHILHKSQNAGRQLALNTGHQPVLRDWSNALKQAWWFELFGKKLGAGFATFSFFKKDGTIREARGTRFLPLIPADKWPKNDPQHPHIPPPSVFTFFDLDKQDWRSFDISSFIGFVSYYQITGHK